ncbi:MAG: hypothetical protein FWE47_01245 [Oscillospiraceae bacterium]|nr:hypothetical protein [Oscillospiraceae bacterium]
MKYCKKGQLIYINSINQAKNENKRKLINSTEIYYHDKVCKVVELAMLEDKHIILLTGPSSSGKTTTSILLSNDFERFGKKAIRISLDNFYRNRDELPLWEDGTKNFETIDGLDLNLFSSTVNELIQNGEAQFPIFDFSTGKKSNHSFSVKYDPDTFIIFEGIHALNPVFDKILGGDRILKLYVSPHTDFVDDDANVVLSGRDLRLIRRMLRDNTDRATPPEMTMEFWDKVCRGEDEYIQPYKTHADAHINSTHFYEPLVYKLPLKKLLSQVDSPEYKEKFEHLIAALEHFDSISVTDVPKTSLLREFISEMHYTPAPMPRDMQ